MCLWSASCMHEASDNIYNCTHYCAYALVCVLTRHAQGHLHQVSSSVPLLGTQRRTTLPGVLGQLCQVAMHAGRILGHLCQVSAVDTFARCVRNLAGHLTEDTLARRVRIPLPGYSCPLVPSECVCVPLLGT